MNAASMVVVLAAMGVNFGWQPADDEPDGYEYVVQIEPELLDVMNRGERVPIESHVPPEIAPIRKVSIVVGRGELPRESLGAVSRTAYFAGQPAWTPDRYNTVAPAAATTTDDRYTMPPATNNRSAVGPPPSVLDRAQAAATETGNALRDGVEAGIQAANEQLYRGGEQVRDTAASAGQQFGQQLQEFARDPQRQLEAAGNDLQNAAQKTVDGVGNQLQQVTNPFASAGTQPSAAANRTQRNVAPPPWPIAGSPAASPRSDGFERIGQATPGQTTQPSTIAPSQTPTGWTSINPNVAGPPMALPPLATSAPRTNNAATARNASKDGGPAFPSAASMTRQPIHSVLADPSDSSNTQSPSDDWAAGWDSTAGATPATIGRARNVDANDQASISRGSELVPVQPLDMPQQRYQPAPQSQQASSGWDESWANGDLWSQPPQSSPTNTTTASAQSPPPLTGANATLSPNTAAQENIVNSNASANNGVDSGSPAAATPNQQPWLPLLVVSLSLMGSLSANLFLGWSYMDARQKYRSLVQKTASAFRRTKPTAA